MSLESRFGHGPRRIGLRASHAAESILTSSFCVPRPARRARMTRFKSGAGHAFRASARIPADKPGSASRSSSAHGNHRLTLSPPGPASLSHNSQNSQAFAPSAAWPSGFFWPASPAGRASLSGGRHSFRRSSSSRMAAAGTLRRSFRLTASPREHEPGRLLRILSSLTVLQATPRTGYKTPFPS